jgi:hypothetical protein
MIIRWAKPARKGAEKSADCLVRLTWPDAYGLSCAVGIYSMYTV